MARRRGAAVAPKKPADDRLDRALAGSPVVDAHSDLLWQLLEADPAGFVEGRPDKHVDLARLREGRVGIQVLALFTPDGRFEHPVVRTLRMIDIAERLVVLCRGAATIARSAADLDAARAAGQVAFVLSIENGIAVLDRLELLRTYYRLGVRAIGLVWNGRNAIGDGVRETSSGGALTGFGREVVAEMERLGMVVDVSHLSRAGFWDVVTRTRRPFIASHSNARAVCDHVRNLDDEQVRAVAERGGVCGVAFETSFLATGRPATLDDVLRHVDHLVEVGGIDHVGFGSDFEGIEKTPSGLEHVGRYPALAAALLDRGHDVAAVRKLLGGNFERVFRGVLG